MSGCVRCGDTEHCACWHAACCNCGSKEHGACGTHPKVNTAIEHGDGWCPGCTLVSAGAATQQALAAPEYQPGTIAYGLRMEQR